MVLIKQYITTTIKVTSDIKNTFILCLSTNGYPSVEPAPKRGEYENKDRSNNKQATIIIGLMVNKRSQQGIPTYNILLQIRWATYQVL